MRQIYVSSCEPAGGIYRFALDCGKLHLLDKAMLDRPMYTVLSGNRLYVLLRQTDTETDFGGVTHMTVNADGRLGESAAVVSSEGVVPCHLCVFGGNVYLVNYLSGNVVCVGGAVRQHSGRSVNPARQEAPHTHFVQPSPDGKYLLCCDLGLDRIYTLDAALNEVSSVQTIPGDGPRHLAYSEDGQFVYCANELSSTVGVYAYADGKLTLLRTVSCAEKANGNAPAAIRRRDGLLWVSNRGEDTISCFRTEGDRLEFVSRTPVGGSFPRDFAFADGYLVCANEHSDSVTVFRAEDGRLIQTDAVSGIRSPLCVTVL